MVKNKKLDALKASKGFIMEQAFYQYFEEPKTFAVHYDSGCTALTVNENDKNVLYCLRPYHPQLQNL